MSVQTEVRESVFHIRLDRPEKRNAFDDGIVQALINAFDRAAAEPGVRVIVLEAAGKHFSAGADLGWMRRMADMSQEENRADALQLATLMQRIDHADKPVVCRVQGAAFGGALGLICAADIAVAADDARFCLSEVRLGILPAVIAPYVVRALGPRQAQRYFMTAEQIPAGRALELGLVHECVPEAELDAHIATLVEALGQGAPGAQLRSRELIEHVAWKPADREVLDWTAGLIARLRSGPEGREGLDAFLEKRSPAWRTDHSQN